MTFLEQTQIVFSVFGFLLTFVGLFFTYLMYEIAVKALYTWKEQHSHSLLEKMFTKAPEYYVMVNNLRSTLYKNISEDEIKLIETNYNKSKFIGYRKDLKNSYNYLMKLKEDRDFLSETLIKIGLLPQPNSDIKKFYTRIKKLIDDHEICLRNLDFATDLYDQAIADKNREEKLLTEFSHNLESFDELSFAKKYNWIETKEQAQEHIKERTKWIESRNKLAIKANLGAISLHKKIFSFDEDMELKNLYDKCMESISKP